MRIDDNEEQEMQGGGGGVKGRSFRPSREREREMERASADTAESSTCAVEGGYPF